VRQKDTFVENTIDSTIFGKIDHFQKFVFKNLCLTVKMKKILTALKFVKYVEKNW
jgi:hypothetical protein